MRRRRPGHDRGIVGESHFKSALRSDHNDYDTHHQAETQGI